MGSLFRIHVTQSFGERCVMSHSGKEVIDEWGGEGVDCHIAILATYKTAGYIFILFVKLAYCKDLVVQWRKSNLSSPSL